MMNLDEVAEWTGGRRHGEAEIREVSTDTRTIRPGALFVALRGARFDGHDHLAEADAAGAAAALVEPGVKRPSLPRVEVADTGQGLLDLAAGWRRLTDAEVVAITGSCGKTTVKEMVASILRAAEARTLATPGNHNNTVGLPLTLFGLSRDHRYAVVEVGINRPGEMERLAPVAAPDVAVITNAAAAHLEGLGSLEGVATEKGRLLQGLGPDGVAVLNADSPFVEQWARSAPGAVLRFGMDAPAEVRGAWEAAGSGGRLWLRLPDGEGEVRLPLPGRHNACNALAAAAAASALGIPRASVIRGLEAVVPASGRLHLRAGLGGLTVLDDTYNANPASLAAALDVLAGEAVRTWLVLGDMGELGASGAELHRQAGEQALAVGVNHLLAVGDLAGEAVCAFGGGGRRVAHWEEVADILETEAASGDRVLIKGSRTMRLERLVARLTGEY
ncbi:UDP-N-acetylmuramoyl-tripeptide--D-alanyl-D-alanine ligase [Thiohalorhabdus sp. Cl-TMA]|uniref:UDP-N-acetylmuramoyl-tripeptide--D-alanyl-D-alanine ligase n=1 Tax=Thiohalorhabdus methylotrophus TaxID=3242694 RepID=A0ABV4TZ24_9GAMM